MVINHAKWKINDRTSVSKINCNKFDKIYVIALKEHVDKYTNPSRLVESLKNISKKVELFLLKKDTSCQTETILEFIKQKN